MEEAQVPLAGLIPRHCVYRLGRGRFLQSTDKQKNPIKSAGQVIEKAKLSGLQSLSKHGCYLKMHLFKYLLCKLGCHRRADSASSFHPDGGASLSLRWLAPGITTVAPINGGDGSSYLRLGLLRDRSLLLCGSSNRCEGEESGDSERNQEATPTVPSAARERHGCSGKVDARRPLLCAFGETQSDSIGSPVKAAEFIIKSRTEPGTNDTDTPRGRTWIYEGSSDWTGERVTSDFNDDVARRF